jgi:hypothetical protein
MRTPLRALFGFAATALFLIAFAGLAFAQPKETPKPTPTPTPAKDAKPPVPTPTPAGDTKPQADPATPTPGNDADADAEPAPGEPVDPEAIPVNLRLRRLEQRVQALKERAWRAKARVGMLKESVLGGGVGAQATLIHVNKMGSSYRLVKLVYALDGTQIFSRNDESATTLYKSKSFDILTGPISPGSHTISVIAIYRGHGYGVFKYLNKYTFTVRSSHTFTAQEGKATRIEAVGFEKGGKTTRLEDRPAIDFKVTAGTGTEK